MFLFGGRQNQFWSCQIVFLTNWKKKKKKGKKSCSTQNTTKNTRNIKISGEEIKLFTRSIRTTVLHGSKTTEKAKSQVIDSPQLLRDTLHDNMNHYRNQQQWILWLYKAKSQKSQKILDTDLTVGLKKEPHPDIWYTESTCSKCVQLLCFSFVHKTWYNWGS